MIIAHTHGAVKMSFHGTYEGFFLEVDDPIASSISLRSSCEILGCLAGLSKMRRNQQIDQKTPMPPEWNQIAGILFD
jgi:hypothetical protein